MPVFFSLMMMEAVEMQLTLREHFPCADPTQSTLCVLIH